ncbi:CoA ester lyase [Aureimonas sp. OT7]|uniref:HpcH/HpaI aldolase/citrate lyase family protein n=1 Tax=Aureimonas sp. OT7 TaxID=2816454 RepID=UPI00177F26A7|nr:CoA ester lyase [Aureimonas sp. OT7]QOG07133.1 CoA ester lyase [Aureimonas sp. OT7]
MTQTPRFLRSALFVPAANGRALARSADFDADALIFDLEDSAAPEEKAGARERLRDHLATPRGSAMRVVRINPLATLEGTEDLLMARGAHVDAILVPKVDRAADLLEVSAALEQTDAPPALQVWAMVETPLGILNAGAIAAVRMAYPLGALVAGPNDIVAAGRLRPSAGRPELIPWLAQIVLAGRAHGIPVLDGVYNDFRDAEGFAAECTAGRRMGFDGKTLIHPSQVERANAAFGPTAEEVEAARDIVAAFDDPANSGRGVIRIGGRMVERLHLVDARRLLDIAESIPKPKDRS